MNDCCSHRLVVARKNHRCDMCGKAIAKASTHEVQSGIADGNPYRIRLHLFCAAVCSAIWRNERKHGNHCFEGVDFAIPIRDYLDICSFNDWKQWLGLIRAEHRKMKGKTQ